MGRKETEEGRGRQRACMRGASESVTRSDRRQRELEARKPVAAAHRPSHTHGAITLQTPVHEDILS